jgi:PhnB protein
VTGLCSARLLSQQKNTNRLRSASHRDTVFWWRETPGRGVLRIARPQSLQEKYCAMKVRTYLNYGGNCEEAFRFYEQHLGAKIQAMMGFDQMPGAHSPSPKGTLHASLTFGDVQIMASDVEPERFGAMRSAYICLGVDSDAEAERIYGILNEGGEIFIPMAETFFATRFAQLRDKFGTLWMIIHEKPMGPPTP